MLSTATEAHSASLVRVGAYLFAGLLSLVAELPPLKKTNAYSESLRKGLFRHVGVMESRCPSEEVIHEGTWGGHGFWGAFGRW